MYAIRSYYAPPPDPDEEPGAVDDEAMAELRAPPTAPAKPPSWAFNQNLWKEYFSNTTIEERKNLKLQKKMLPQRYRKNLTETKF